MNARAPEFAAAAEQDRLVPALRAESALYVRALHTARTGRPRDIHALRIATRRMLALLEFAAALAPSGKWRGLARELRRPFRKCARLRDLQATRAHLRRMRAGWRGLRPLLDAVLASLREDIRRHQRRAIAGLEAARPRRTTRRIVRLARKRAASARPADGARGCIDRSRRNVRAACRRMRTGGIEALHRARVAIKLCRYQLDLAPRLGLRVSPGERLTLRRLQKELGAVTDLELLQHELKRFARHHRGQRRALAQARGRIRRAREMRRKRALAMAARDAIVLARTG
ncbi:MAG TPA: CHAD domain-containing protein [Steroidobacteraceae bacterium]|nr:CHAD domain-containing protein [Steroidobacteraceae bacterium]